MLATALFFSIHTALIQQPQRPLSPSFSIFLHLPEVGIPKFQNSPKFSGALTKASQRFHATAPHHFRCAGILFQYPVPT